MKYRIVSYRIAIALTSLFLGLFVSCKKETSKPLQLSPNAQIESPTSVLNRVKIQTHRARRNGTNLDNFLIFESKEDFHSAVEALQTYSESDLINWESGLDFVSMRKKFNEVVNAEIELADAPLSSGQPAHSQLSIDLSYMLVTRTTDDGAGYYDPNIHDYRISYVTNHQGVVQVGDLIYMHSDQYIKIITDGDASKLEDLERATVSDLANNIEVYQTPSHASYFRAGNSWNISGSNKCGRMKVIVYQDFIQNATGNQNEYTTTFSAKARSLKKRLFGAWYDNWKVNLSISGEHNGNEVSGWLPNGVATTVNYTDNYYMSFFNHTLSVKLPDNGLQGFNGLRTDFNHPTIYSASNNVTGQHVMPNPVTCSCSAVK